MPGTSTAPRGSKLCPRLSNICGRAIPDDSGKSDLTVVSSDPFCRSSGAFEPCEKKLIANGQNDRTDEEADDADGEKSANCTEEDHGYGNGDTASEQQWLQHIVHNPPEYPPDQKQDRLCGAGDCEHIDDGGNQHDGSRLKDRSDQKNQRPQPRAWNSCDEKSETGSERL